MGGQRHSSQTETHTETPLFGSSQGKVLKRKVNECVFVRPPVTQTSSDQRQLELGRAPAKGNPKARGLLFQRHMLDRERDGMITHPGCRGEERGGAEKMDE